LIRIVANNFFVSSAGGVIAKERALDCPFKEISKPNKEPARHVSCNNVILCILTLTGRVRESCLFLQKENPLSQLRQKIEERKRRKLVKMEGHISQDLDPRHDPFITHTHTHTAYILISIQEQKANVFGRSHHRV
jgi:hypothetical protein